MKKALAIAILLSGCASINNALDTMAPGKAKLSTTNSATKIDKIYDISNRSSKDYQISGMKIEIFNIHNVPAGTWVNWAGVHFKGTVQNKTNHNINLDFSLPINNPSGQHVRTMDAYTYVPAHGSAAIDATLTNQIHWAGGERPDVQNLKIHVQRVQ